MSARSLTPSIASRVLRLQTLGFAACLLSLLPSQAGAQSNLNTARGVNTSASFSSLGIDTINNFNGGLSLAVPLGQFYPVSASLGYQLVLRYDGQVWDHRQVSDAGGTWDQAIPALEANGGLGWRLSFGRLNPPRAFVFDPPADFSRNYFVGPDGSAHYFYSTLHGGESPTPGVEYSRDGSYLRLRVNARQIEFPDGSTQTFDVDGYPVSIHDRFNNTINIAYCFSRTNCSTPVSSRDANAWKITDSHFREHWVTFLTTTSVWQPRLVQQVDLQAFAGQRALYTFTYNQSGAAIPLEGCRDTDPNYAGAPTWLLTDVGLPDGSHYWMPMWAYSTSTAAPCSSGMLLHFGLPTRGAIQWSWMDYSYPLPSSKYAFARKTTGVSTRRLVSNTFAISGTWTYSTALDPWAPNGVGWQDLINTVTDPLGHKVTRYFSVCASGSSNCGERYYEYGLPLTRLRPDSSDGAGRWISEEVTPAGSTTIARRAFVAYEHDAVDVFDESVDRSRLNQRVKTTRTVYCDDDADQLNPQTCGDDDKFADQTLSLFDGLGHYRQRDTGGNFPGSNVRSAHTNFNSQRGTYGQPGYTPLPASAPWVLNNDYTFSSASEGGQVLYRSLCVDPATGFVTGKRTHSAGMAPSSSDLLETFAQAGGNVTSESFYGGDNQLLNTGASVCAMASQPLGSNGAALAPTYQYTHSYAAGTRRQTRVTVGTTLNLLDLDIDSSTGLPIRSRDTAGIQQSATYDLLGRVTRIDPSDAGIAPTTISYCTASQAPPCPNQLKAQVVVDRSLSGSTLAGMRQELDDWGRLIKEEERMPPAGGFVARTFKYDAAGSRFFISEPDSAQGTTLKSFDAFGRPTVITPPDGVGHNVALSYLGVRQLARTVKVATAAGAETAATTTEVYDRHGRLFEVAEPGGVKTRHEYDAGNRLKRLCGRRLHIRGCPAHREFHA